MTCENCHDKKSPINKIRSCVLYEEIIQRLILKLKNGSWEPIAPFLADLIKKIILTEEFYPHIITCVPLSRLKMFSRGFNQGAIILNQLQKKLGKRFERVHYLPGLLLKIKNTPSQMRLPRGLRLENIQGSFAINPQYDVKGKDILIIDDVVTTGSTLKECAKILKNHGAKKVYAFTVARANVYKDKFHEIFK
jgi:ComF family protein